MKPERIFEEITSLKLFLRWLPIFAQKGDISPYEELSSAKPEYLIWNISDFFFSLPHGCCKKLFLIGPLRPGWNWVGFSKIEFRGNDHHFGSHSFIFFTSYKADKFMSRWSFWHKNTLMELEIYPIPHQISMTPY